MWSRPMLVLTFSVYVGGWGDCATVARDIFLKSACFHAVDGPKLRSKWSALEAICGFERMCPGDGAMDEPLASAWLAGSLGLPVRHRFVPVRGSPAMLVVFECTGGLCVWRPGAVALSEPTAMLEGCPGMS